MKPGFPLWCLLLLAVVSLNAGLVGAHDATHVDGDVTYYFNVVDGELALTSLPPSSSSPTQWTLTGSFQPRNGLNLVIPIENPDPNVIVDEAAGARGWAVTSYSYSYSGTSAYPYSAYGVFSWRLVQGDQSANLAYRCGNNDNHCYGTEPRYYGAEFPGHAPDRPHTHGNGTDADRPHYAGDFRWELVYKVAPCTAYLSCPILGGSVQYKFSVLVDGTTDVHFVADDVAPPEPEPAEPPAVNETQPASNGTTNGTTAPPSGGSGGNETGNGTGGQGGNESAGAGAPGSAFKPAAYKSEPSGTAPGAPLAALIVGTLATAIARRRLGRA